ncbi:hypothetical protein [Ruegeria atlantica]|uniref:hypothetical protein n=1 Tax=Ruegeria atlantica TaxID=81569 RepID=UPI00147F0EFE|nr:hypothetical protein [Ruegeria atlantica]
MTQILSHMPLLSRGLSALRSSCEEYRDGVALRSLHARTLEKFNGLDKRELEDIGVSHEDLVKMNQKRAFGH